MRRVVALAEVAADLERARSFYEAQAAGVGDYCVASLLTDIASLALFHGIHRRQYGCLRPLANRFPFGIYYLEMPEETQVVAVLDLRRDPAWIRNQVTKRQQ